MHAYLAYVEASGDETRETHQSLYSHQESHISLTKCNQVVDNTIELSHSGHIHACMVSMMKPSRVFQKIINFGIINQDHLIQGSDEDQFNMVGRIYRSKTVFCGD